MFLLIQLLEKHARKHRENKLCRFVVCLVGQKKLSILLILSLSLSIRRFSCSFNGQQQQQKTSIVRILIFLFFVHFVWAFVCRVLVFVKMMYRNTWNELSSRAFLTAWKMNFCFSVYSIYMYKFCFLFHY